MGNPMLQMLNQQSRPLNNNMLSMMQNPQQLLNNLMAKNPQISMLINQYGNGDPKRAFYKYAEITGQDPNQILNMIKGMM